MRKFRIAILALVPIVAMSAEVAPAGSEVRRCELGRAIDPGLRAAFVAFDRNQSATAARACAFHFNNGWASLGS